MSSNTEMQNMATPDTSMRIRISIPPDDKAVIAWVNAQHDRSMSIRMIIRDAIEKYGTRDFFATAEGEIQQRNTPGPKPSTVRKEAEKTPKPEERAPQNEPVPQIQPAPRVQMSQPSANPAAQSALQSMLDI